MALAMDAPVTVLKGIGTKHAARFADVGIATLGDLVRFYPRAYETFRTPADDVQGRGEGELVCVRGAAARAVSVRRFGHKSVCSVPIALKEGMIEAVWWNMPYLHATLQPGQARIFRGRLAAKGSKLILQQPRIYGPEEYEALSGSLQPVYPLSKGLTVSLLRKAIAGALDQVSLEDPLPENLIREYELLPYETAVRAMHFPQREEDFGPARRRLAFDEFLQFILSLKLMRSDLQQTHASGTFTQSHWARTLLESLPYELTGAQQWTWQQLLSDMGQDRPMTRLLQGDVGSGKTILAFLCMIAAAESGYQAALMAPTLVLAAQHYEGFVKLTEQAHLPVRAVLLTGSMTAKQKREAYELIRTGEASVIIGTHALFQEMVDYHNLALVITDEQHRFGVRQRSSLAGKGGQPHTLVMSATPIPRTLAVILYGDLDISVLDEMPRDRRPVKTAVVGHAWREKAWRFMADQVRAGHQCYVICPLIEASEQIDGENVIDYAARLTKHYGSEIRVGILHGRMSDEEKDRIMHRFQEREIDVLVSTTVVEVGVNVPNATVMMIEDAQRFGLSALHQLRGRVGRSDVQSYCILMHAGEEEEVSQRLKLLQETTDGFEIARKDLKLRGPGDLFGVRQTGELPFRVADVFADADVLTSASQAASRILGEDPDLTSETWRPLREAVMAGHDPAAEGVAL